MMIPARLALALQAAGWILRNDVIWAKHPMPEPRKGWRYERKSCPCVTERREMHIQRQMAEQGVDRHRIYDKAGTKFPPDPDCPDCRGSGHYGEPGLIPESWRHTKSHEYVFQLVKKMHYYGNHLRVATTTGANPLDVVTPSRTNYSGKHFAVFPPLLIAPLVQASTPKQCCSTCGKPWAPVIENKIVIEYRPTCEHICLSCSECGSVIECSHEVCNQAVRMVRKSIPTERPEEESDSEILQQVMRVPLEREEPENYEGEVQEHEGLHSSPRAGPPKGLEGGIHDGASTRDGEEDREIARTKRDSTPHKLNKGRQRTRKSGAHGKESPRSKKETSDIADSVPALQEDNQSLQSCEKCGGRLIPESKPGIILDPFMGSGTTGLVAREFRVNFVGADISFQYLNEQAKVRSKTGQPSGVLDDLPLFNLEARP